MVLSYEQLAVAASFRNNLGLLEAPSLNRAEMSSCVTNCMSLNVSASAVTER